MRKNTLLIQMILVTPREGRVSRNLTDKQREYIASVTPREGRVSRNTLNR